VLHFHASDFDLIYLQIYFCSGMVVSYIDRVLLMLIFNHPYIMTQVVTIELVGEAPTLMFGLNLSHCTGGLGLFRSFHFLCGQTLV
jgi:hypothetical protein